MTVNRNPTSNSFEMDENDPFENKNKRKSHKLQHTF